jgi:class 3 adenylate cyclase
MDVGVWLRSLGLGQYERTFRDNAIDVDVFADLTDDDLEKLGLPLGDRKRLLRAISGLVGTPAAATKSEPAAARPPRPAAAQSPPPLSASPSPIEAERRHLTVMFIDLVDSTALSEKLDPEDMREIIRSYQNTVAGELMRFKGHIAKFMGDGVLAYFGWPRAHEDDAERAVRAGRAVTQAIARVQTSDRISLQARIGIASGIVIVGDLIGDGAAQERSVVGATPNLAARLQSAAEPGTALVAQSTRQLIGDFFTLREVGSRSFKGIAEATPVFEVLAERSLETRFAARQLGGLTPIVARDQELAFLIERWRQSGRGDAQFLLLSGGAGIGKSRISEALIDVLSDEPHFTIRYQCSPYHTYSALHPAIQQIAHAMIRVIPTDSACSLSRSTTRKRAKIVWIWRLRAIKTQK